MRKELFLVLSWTLAIASIFAQALYQRSFMTTLDYLMVFLICLVAGAVMADLGKAILGYVGAMIVGMIILFVLTTLPASTGVLVPPADLLVYSLWASIILTSVFPLPFIVFLVASILGSFLGERYFAD